MTIFDYIIGIIIIVVALPLWLYETLKNGGKK